MSRPDAAGIAFVPALAAGLCVPSLAGAGTMGVGALALGALVGAWRLDRRRLAGVQLIAALCGLAAGGLWSGERLAQLARDPLGGLVGREVAGRAVVTGQVYEGRSTWSAAASLDGSPVELRAHVPLATGAILLVRGRLSRPRGAAARGAFDEREWLERQGVHEILRVRGAVVAGRRGGVQGAADRLREAARRALSADRGGVADDVVAGILLGTTAPLPPRVRAAFRASGLQHLLAVSGGNVALLVALVLGGAWLLGASRPVGHALAIACVAAYALVVGPGPSVVRATVTGIVTSLAWLGGRPQRAAHVLALGAVVVVGLDPFAPLEPGFQLSFAAVAAILWLAPGLRRRLEGAPCPDVLRAPIAISVSCTAATAPISWWHFGRAALLGSLPANLLALPVVAPMLWLALAAVALAPLLPAATLAIDVANGVLARYLVFVAETCAGLDRLSPAALSAAPPLLAAVALALALGARRRRAAHRR